MTRSMSDPRETIAVVDFETTGYAISRDGRTTEVAVVLVRGHIVLDGFQSLMRTGALMNPLVVSKTGITRAMLEGAPAAGKVMREVAAFAKGCPLAASQRPVRPRRMGARDGPRRGRSGPRERLRLRAPTVPPHVRVAGSSEDFERLRARLKAQIQRATDIGRIGGRRG
jgi:hypothetical protein